MKSCECIETIEANDIEITGLEPKMMAKSGTLDFFMAYGLKAKKKRKPTWLKIEYCPFCGRELHEITDETRAERQRIAKEAAHDNG